MTAGLSTSAFGASVAADPGEPLSFWNEQRRGANSLNAVETRDRFRAAREAGLEWVRLVPDKPKGGARIALWRVLQEGLATEPRSRH
jgi:hypothetical protein